MARTDLSLTKDQLQGFARAFGAEKLERFQRHSLPALFKDDPQEIYENHREVAISAVQAARDARPVIDESKILKWSDKAGITREAALANMSTLQHVTTLGTAAYCIKIAVDFRLSPARGLW